MRKTRLLPIVLIVFVIVGIVGWRLIRSRTTTPTPNEEIATPEATAEAPIDECDYGGAFKSIEAVDTYTVKFTLCYPEPAFPAKVASGSLAIYPAEYLQKTGGGGDLLTKPIGTGPYVFKSWTPGKEIAFTANPNYWGGAPQEANLIFRWNGENQARLIMLQNGEVDGVDNMSSSDIEYMSVKPDMLPYRRGGTNIMYLGFNNTVEPFDKPEVRQAIAYALDRQEIIDKAYSPLASVAYQFVPPPIFGYTSEVTSLDAGMTYEEKIAKAKELLASVGLEEGFEATLTYRHMSRVYLPDPDTTAQNIFEQLGVINIVISTQIIESGAFLDAVDAGDVDFYMLGWTADYPDPTNFLDFHFGYGSSNQFGDKNTQLADILMQASSTSNLDKRYQLYITANEIIRDEVPALPIAYVGSAAAFRREISGAYASDLGAEQFWRMQDPDDDTIIWMQTAEPLSLYCADETDLDTLRACEQVNESLMRYDTRTGIAIPALARSYTANEDLTEWTFTLREGVQFHDGSDFDANDVVSSYKAVWDASSPLHVGRTGSFAYFQAYFFNFLNAYQPIEEE